MESRPCGLLAPVNPSIVLSHAADYLCFLVLDFSVIALVENMKCFVVRADSPQSRKTLSFG